MTAFVLPENPTEGLTTDVVEGRRLVWPGICSYSRQFSHP